MWPKLLFNLLTLGIPAIIDAISRARREKREQEARLQKEAAQKKPTATKKMKKPDK